MIYIYIYTIYDIYIYIYIQYYPPPKSLHKTLGQTTDNGQTTGQIGRE